MPPKKPRPADTGGAKNPVRTGTLTGETPVKEHIKKIEKNGSKEAPKLTGAKKMKEKVVRKPPTKVRSQKKITGLFGNFSQMADPPPIPPFWEPLIQKKFLSFILHFRPLGTFLVFTKKLKFCHFCYIYFWE